MAQIKLTLIETYPKQKIFDIFFISFHLLKVGGCNTPLEVVIHRWRL